MRPWEDVFIGIMVGKLSRCRAKRGQLCQLFASRSICEDVQVRSGLERCRCRFTDKRATDANWLDRGEGEDVMAGDGWCVLLNP